MVGFRGVITVAFSTTSAAMSFAISATHDLQCSEIGMVCAHHNGFAFGVNNASDAAALNAYIAALEKCDLVAVALREPAAIFHVLGLFSGVVIGVFLRYAVIDYSFPQLCPELLYCRQHRNISEGAAAYIIFIYFAYAVLS